MTVRRYFDTAAANTTLRLWNEGKLPGWVLEWLDRRLLEAAAAE